MEDSDNNVQHLKREDTGTYDNATRCLREKIPAHMIIPRKLKKEDTGTYDNTAEVSDNTTEA